jgi:acyl carrier protein
VIMCPKLAVINFSYYSTNTEWTYWLMTNEDIFQKLCDLIGPYNKKSLSLNKFTTFSGDLSMDSLTVMDLVADFEDEFDILIPINILPDLDTIQDVADAIEKIQNRE